MCHCLFLYRLNRSVTFSLSSQTLWKTSSLSTIQDMVTAYEVKVCQLSSAQKKKKIQLSDVSSAASKTWPRLHIIQLQVCLIAHSCLQTQNKLKKTCQLCSTIRLLHGELNCVSDLLKQQHIHNGNESRLISLPLTGSWHAPVMWTCPTFSFAMCLVRELFPHIFRLFVTARLLLERSHTHVYKQTEYCLFLVSWHCII